MPRVVVVGGGWAGCAAASEASKSGCEVVLLERGDCLLGTGRVGGIMRNNGRLTAELELRALGAGELFDVAVSCFLHENVFFPGHRHASLYDPSRLVPRVSDFLRKSGVEVVFGSRVTGTSVSANRLVGVETVSGEKIKGDVFVDSTGSFGPSENCAGFGNGCVSCVMNCPVFGPRCSLSGLSGVEKRLFAGEKGAMSGSCVLDEKTVDSDVVRELKEKGVFVLPLRLSVAREKKKLVKRKSCQQYASPAFYRNLVLLHTGHVKAMTPFISREELEQIPGFEEACFLDPVFGSRGNSVRHCEHMDVGKDLSVSGRGNLFAAGECLYGSTGHTEAVCTGTLAGFNAARAARGKKTVFFPKETAVGDFVSFLTSPRRGLRSTFSGSVFFDRMRGRGLYEVSEKKVFDKVRELGCEGFFPG